MKDTSAVRPPFRGFSGVRVHPPSQRKGKAFVRLVLNPTERSPSVLMPPLEPASLQTEKQPGGTLSPGWPVSTGGLSSLQLSSLLARHAVLRRCNYAYWPDTNQGKKFSPVPISTQSPDRGLFSFEIAPALDQDRHPPHQAEGDRKINKCQRNVVNLRKPALHPAKLRPLPLGLDKGQI